MKVNFFPKTKIGKWALAFFIVEIVMMIVFYAILAIFNVKGGDSFFSNPELFIPILTAYFAGVAAFILGCIAIIKNKSKSVLIYIITLVTLLTTWYGIAEIAFPH